MAINDVFRNLNKIEKEIDNNIQKAIYECSADLLKESNKICPFNNGDLRRSGQVTMKTNEGIVSYGGGTVDYALKVHEIKAKNYTEAGTSWKYLERPLKEKHKQYNNIIKNSVKEVVK